jgi:polyisoprenoid-binding protein YceI
MPRFDASNAECLVFSYKDGLLAKLAHDLKIRVERFTIDVADDRSSVEGTFETTSLAVVCSRKDGRDDPGALSRGDIAKISDNLNDDVLESKKFPKATFASTEVAPQEDGGYRVVGKLTLHGQTRPLVCEVKKDGGKWVTEVRVHQPDFAIKPYSAALGALKVQADVTVKVSTPAG